MTPRLQAILFVPAFMAMAVVDWCMEVWEMSK